MIFWLLFYILYCSRCNKYTFLFVIYECCSLGIELSQGNLVYILYQAFYEYNMIIHFYYKYLQFSTASVLLESNRMSCQYFITTYILYACYFVLFKTVTANYNCRLLMIVLEWLTFLVCIVYEHTIHIIHTHTHTHTHIHIYIIVYVYSCSFFLFGLRNIAANKITGTRSRISETSCFLFFLPSHPHPSPNRYPCLAILSFG